MPFFGGSSTFTLEALPFMVGSRHFLHHQILPLSWDYYLALDANILSSEWTKIKTKRWHFLLFLDIEYIIYVWFQGWSQHLPLPIQVHFGLLLVLPLEPCCLTIPYYSHFSLPLSFSVPFLFELSFHFLLPFYLFPQCPSLVAWCSTAWRHSCQGCPLSSTSLRNSLTNESKQAATTSLCKRARFASLLAKRRSGAARRAT